MIIMTRKMKVFKAIAATLLCLVVLFGIVAQPVHAETYQFVKQADWGTPGWDRSQDMEIHAASNSIYVVGRTNPGPFGLSDVVLLKYTTALDLVWNVTWGGSADDDASDVVASADGSTFVSGYTDSWGAGLSDMILLRYFPNGTLAWNKTWGTSAYDYATSIALDEENGSVYVMGQTTSSGVQDVTITKFYWNGTQAWSTTWGGPRAEYPRGLVLGKDGGLYIGMMYKPVFGVNFIGLAKFMANGTPAWNVTWRNDGTGDELGDDLSQDAAGNFYMGGYSVSPTYSYQFLLLKLNETGGLVWNTEWSGDKTANLIRSTAIDSMGNVYAFGETNSYGAGNQGWVVFKFNTDGIRQWYHVRGSPNYCYADAIAPAPNGDVFAAGFYQALNGSTFISLLRFSPEGATTPPTIDVTLYVIAGLGIGFVITLAGWIVVAKKYSKIKPARGSK